jgi:hypothetical protein
MAVVKAEAKPVKRRTAIGPTIPVKKPLVAKKPRLLAAGRPHGKTAARPATDAAPALTVQGERETDGKILKAARQEAQPVVEAKPHVKTEVKAEKKSGASWVSWLPIAAGIALGSVAPQLFAFAAHWNPWGLRVVFPYVQLCALHEIGMSDELTRTIPQLMLYLQFPLEGLLVASNMRRGARFAAAIGPVPGLHFVGGLVLWIVALGSMRPI